MANARNKLLRIGGGFQDKDHPQSIVMPSLPKNYVISSDELKELLHQLNTLNNEWRNRNLIKNALIDIHYRRIVPKSKRAEKILFLGKSKNANDYVVGARFNGELGKEHHVITYYIDKEALENSLAVLKKTIEVVDSDYGGCIDGKKLDSLLEKKEEYSTSENFSINSRVIAQVIVDASQISSLSTANSNQVLGVEPRYISIYNTEKTIADILTSLDIPIIGHEINQTTALLYPKDQLLLQEKAGYLISMSCSTSEEIISETRQEISQNEPPEIGTPTAEPTIGIIDTQFDEQVYFKKWVEYVDVLKSDYSIEDKAHGTEVASIIVDGPTLNPDYDDGCGCFRVKLFGIATHENVQIDKLLACVENAVANNPQIHVWNMSLGSKREIDRSSVSIVAEKLDELQVKYNVIFVVSGTNLEEKDIKNRITKMVGSPADSINSVVVNAVNINSQRVNYNRKGPVLSFFVKPDICAFGGDDAYGVKVCGPSNNIRRSTGTSFAAPWISRKLAYMIEILKIPREVAKALLIDAAAGWGGAEYLDNKDFCGYGAVPVNISDIVQTRKDEIRFFIYRKISKFNTYMVNLPVPVQNNGKVSYIARASMCYFPHCTRSQGVDYTDYELNLKIGRLNAKGQIVAINNDKQYEEGYLTDEAAARKNCRKWDNTKKITEFYKPNLRDRKASENGKWGIDIKLVRRKDKPSEPIFVGIVVTLKEIHGKNYYDNFVKNCKLESLIVNEIDIASMVNLNMNLEQEITVE